MTEHESPFSSEELQKSTEAVPLSEMLHLDGGNFTLYPLPENTEILTDKTELRQENLPFDFPASEARRVNEKEKKFGERKGLNLLRAPGFGARVNLHNIRLDLTGEHPVLLTDIRPTTFAMASDPEIMKDPQRAEHLSFTGAAAGLTTREKDGSSNTVFGYRLDKNANYPGMGGAAAAGVRKGNWYPQETRTHDQRGRLQPVDSDFFTEGMLNELDEEIHLLPENLVGGHPEPVALIWDAGQAGNPHWEIGYLLEYNGSTADLIRQAAENKAAATEKRGEFDFEEEYIILKGGIEPLWAALAESDSPLPPSHTGLYTGLLLRMMAKEYGNDPEKLQQETERLEAALQEQAERNDRKVAQFYRDNPEAAEEARAKGYNTEGYDFRVPVVKQGLNDFREWARGRGYLVEENVSAMNNTDQQIADLNQTQETIKSQEQGETLDRRDVALLFDLDGVLTDPDTKVVNRENVAVVARELKARRPIGFATGRAYQWVEDNIMPVLKEELGGDESLMELLFVSCEKGGLTVKFENGQLTKHHEEGIALPEDLMEQLRSRIPEGQGVFDDTAKETMFTVEIEGGSDAEKVSREKTVLQNLAHQYEEMVNGTEYEMELTEIALDVQRGNIDKGVAAAEFVKFLKDKYERGVSKVNPQEYFYLMIGDSPKDGKATQYLREKLQYNAAFGYVGWRPLDDDLSYEVIRPENGDTFDKGTNALLRQMNLV